MIHKKLHIFVATLFICGFIATPVNAQDKENPYNAKIKNQAEKLAKSLNEDQIDDLAQLRDIFGMIESIKIVRARVGEAVKSCSSEHEDLKDDITQRFTEWKDHVNPVIWKQRKQLKAAIDKEDRFENPKDVWDYFNLINKAAKHASKAYKPKIVTSHEACEGLYKSMENTMEEVAEILETVEFPK